jgi:hypothetical protein
MERPETSSTHQVLTHKPPPPPNAAYYNIPGTDEEYKNMVKGMEKFRMPHSEAEANIKSRKTGYNKSSREHKRDKPKQKPAKKSPKAVWN